MMACRACGAGVPEGARFCPACGAPVTAPELAGDELRPVTALFADLVGSTALGERLAPEEVKALVGECVTRFARAVEEYGGMVQAYTGDGVCAYFGVPVAHEDDPERAARAGLRILELAAEYADEIRRAWDIEEVSVRVGINTGQTGVGVVGASDPQPVALGDATNVAARLQAVAAPGTIVVGETTARRLEHRFTLDTLGDVQVKGREAPVAAWRLSRRAGRGQRAAGPVIGREGEVAQLSAVAADLVESGRGHALLVVGEAGLGKTRLVAELGKRTAGRVTWLEGECLSYGGLLGWPFIQLLRRWLDVDIEAAEVVIRTRARALLTGVLGDEAQPVLAAFLGVLRVRSDGNEPAAPASSVTDAAGAYAHWLEALGAQRPVVLVVEDAHWADEPTVELTRSLLELTDRLPLLVVVTLRPDPGTPGAAVRSHILTNFPHRATDLRLGPLGKADARRLLDTLLPGGVDEETAGELVQRAEGNPLYLEELLRALAEAGGIERRRTWTLTPSSRALLPPALENLLIARIDRLPPAARRLAQVAAVIGREFPSALLTKAAVTDDSEANIALLLRAGIIEEVRRWPEAILAFKHGLLQDAAATTLTPARRASIARQVAQAAEEVYAASLERHLEALARWHAESGDTARAIDYLEAAAARIHGPEADELRRRARSLADRAELRASDAASG